MEIAYFNIYGSVNTRMEEICDRFPIRAIRCESEEFHVETCQPQQATRGGLERLLLVSYK